MTLVTEGQDVMCQWASLIIFGEPNGFQAGDKSIGVIENNELICVVVYNHIVLGHSLSMSVASVDKRWANRHNLRAFFDYPFIQLGLERVQTLCSAQNEGVQMFNKRLGFQQEGYHRKGWHDFGDAISWGMLRSECKWVQ